MSFDRANATYRDLCRYVTSGGIGVVPFVGAGLSVYGPDPRIKMDTTTANRVKCEMLSPKKKKAKTRRPR